MNEQVLKVGGLMEAILLQKKEPIFNSTTSQGTEQIPHRKSDDSICGHARSVINFVNRAVTKELRGHQRPY